MEDRNVSAKVFENIKQSIINGELAAGEKLVEREIADRLDVSRTPVREAIRLLEAEGFVVKMQHKGAIVAEIMKEDLLKLYSLRIALECLAARWAAESCENDDLRILEELLCNLENGAENNDREQLIRENDRFHSKIVAISNCKTMIKVFSTLLEKIQIAMRVSGVAFCCAANDHRAIFDAIKKKDRESAEFAMERHICRSLDFLSG